jgi:uncharacterized phage protein gp47/JayE
MAFGLTATGLEIKRLADIKPEIEDILRQRLGNSINLMPEAVFGQIVGTFSERESEIWEKVEDVYHSQYPDDSEGASLDNAVAFSGIRRLESAKSVQRNQLLFGDVGTTVPVNTQFSVNGNPDAKFKTRNSATLVAGLNAIQSLSFSADPDAGSFTLIHRSQTTVSIPFGAAALDVQNALNGLPHLSGVVVTGDFSTGFSVEFDDDDGLQAQQLIGLGANSLTASAVPVVVTIAPTQVGLPQALVDLEAVDAGPVNAPIGTLTVIDTPVSGLNRTINVEATVIGRNRENDVQLKARREETLAVGGNATIEAIRSKVKNLEAVTDAFVFENDTLVTDIDGRPGKSYECVVDGGDEDAIADVIWKSKPGGIRTYGQISKNVIDSQGVTRVIQFSRPTQVQIFTSLDLTVDVATFPVNGALKVKELLLAWGSSLGIGRDVIVYPQLVAQLASVPGILDVRVRVDTSPVSNTPGAPAVDDNIDIQPFEVASFADSDTVVNVL